MAIQFELQRAELSDVDAIWEIERDIASRISGKIENKEQVKDYYFHYSTEVYLVIKRREVAGVVAIRDMGDMVELSSLLLFTNAQDKGLGRLILQKIVEKYGSKQMFLFTHPENVRSLITYMKCGFIITGWIENKYGDGEPRVRMVRSATIFA